MQYLSFDVADRELIVPLSQVTEILPWERVSALVGAPAFVRGVVQVRGRAVVVLDLALRLGLAQHASTKRTSIMMLELGVDGERMPVGVAITGVARLIEVDPASLQPTPPLAFDLDARFVHGLLSFEGRMLPLIDVVKLFAADTLRALAAGGAA